MKELVVPYIDGLEGLTLERLDEVMEVHASKGFISEVNWKEWPYAPSVSFKIARSRSSLYIMYHVRGLDIRATVLEDNGTVWEDSCCEFFISHPSGDSYFNFELTCIGTLLAARRVSRDNADLFSEDKLERIIRYTSLDRTTREEQGGIHSWSAAIAIPFDLIGMDPESLPSSARANFYKCGDKTAHPHYLSWNRIDIPLPDFHRPDHFGRLIF